MVNALSLHTIYTVTINHHGTSCICDYTPYQFPHIAWPHYSLVVPAELLDQYTAWVFRKELKKPGSSVYRDINVLKSRLTHLSHLTTVALKMIMQQQHHYITQ